MVEALEDCELVIVDAADAGARPGSGGRGGVDLLRPHQPAHDLEVVLVELKRGVGPQVDNRFSSSIDRVVKASSPAAH